MFQFVSRHDDTEADLPHGVRAERDLPAFAVHHQHLLAHPNDRESPAFLTKFRACPTRALEMVRSHMKRVLEDP